MKVRLPTVTYLTKKQQEYGRAFAKEVAKQLYNQNCDKYSRRFFKLFCLALAEEFGFGKVRLSRVLNRVQLLVDESEKDELFWRHGDMVLKQIGMDFNNENYDEVEV